MDIPACVEKLVPAFQMKGSATIKDRADYESRTWLSAGKRPSWTEIQAIWPTVEQETAEPPPAVTMADLEARVKALEDT